MLFFFTSCTLFWACNLDIARSERYHGSLSPNCVVVCQSGLLAVRRGSVRCAVRFYGLCLTAPYQPGLSTVRLFLRCGTVRFGAVRFTRTAPHRKILPRETHTALRRTV